MLFLVHHLLGVNISVSSADSYESAVSVSYINHPFRKMPVWMQRHVLGRPVLESLAEISTLSNACYLSPSRCSLGNAWRAHLP